MHRVATSLQHRDGGRPDTARRAGDDDRPLSGRLPIHFHPMQRERGGEAGRAERHRLAEVESRRQRHDPVCGRAHHLREPAVVRFAEAHAIDQDRVTRLEAPVGRRLDAPRDVDARVQREPFVDRRTSGDAQRVLEVDARPFGTDDDGARREVVERDLRDAGDDALGLTEHSAGQERHGTTSRMGPSYKEVGGSCDLANWGSCELTCSQIARSQDNRCGGIHDR